MYRTDKQFMKNPATAASRIFIGNLAEGLIPCDLEDKFKVHGKILGLVLQRGFGFIQYEKDTEAQAAIDKEHGTMFHGRRINVKQAYEKKTNFKPQQSQQNQSHSQQHQQDNPPPVEEPPKETQPPQQDKPKDSSNKASSTNVTEKSPGKSPAKSNAPEDAMSTDDNFRDDKFQDDKFREDSFRDDNYQQDNYSNKSRESHDVHDHDDDSQHFEKRGKPFDSFSGPPEKRRRAGRGRGGHMDFGRPPMDKFRDAPPPKFYGNKDPYPASYIPPPVVDVPAPPERNDCEIIVVTKALTEYAEFIEQKLKAMGLIVDLLFPNEDVPIGRVLANISSRGCLYAILVMPKNEENRSLTLDILHGIPQEHRNMPIEDALKLISRNFDAYMRGEKTTALPGVSGPNMSLDDRHPEQIQILLNLLAENRQLTTSQYDRILKYLEERRELQKQYESAEGVESTTEPEANKAAELQNRILNILNKSGGNSDSPKPVVQAESSGSTGPTPLLNDPSVQKALDSLLSGDMLKGIAAGM